MSVKAMDEGLDGRFTEMTQVRCRLARFLTQNHHVWVDEPKRINHNLHERNTHDISHYRIYSGGLGRFSYHCPLQQFA